MRIQSLLSILLLFGALLAPADSWAVTQKQQEAIAQIKRSIKDLFSQGRYTDALPLIDKIIALDKDDKSVERYQVYIKQSLVEPSCRLANDSYSSAEYARAINEWKGILQRYPEDMRVERMIEFTKNLIQTNFVKTLYAKANEAISKNDYPSAVNSLEKILIIQPDDGNARDLLAMAKQIISTTQIKNLYERAAKYLKDKEYELAIKTWEDILDIDKTQAQASRLISETRTLRISTMYTTAKKLYESGDYVTSHESYHKILGENPTDADSKEIVSRLGNIIKITQKIDGTDQISTMMRFALNNYISLEGNVKAGIVAAWYATQLAPANKLAQSVRAFIEMKHTTEVMSLEPPGRDMNIIDQYLFAALNHIYEGRYDIAVQQCNIILLLEPNNVLAYKRLGSAYYAMDRKDKARQSWEKALKLMPDDQELKKFLKSL